MNVTTQFQDISMKRYGKFPLGRKEYRRTETAAQRVISTNKVITKFYDNEFRKWHIKLALIIVLCCASLYFSVLLVSGVLHGFFS